MGDDDQINIPPLTEEQRRCFEEQRGRGKNIISIELTAEQLAALKAAARASQCTRRLIDGADRADARRIAKEAVAEVLKAQQLVPPQSDWLEGVFDRMVKHGEITSQSTLATIERVIYGRMKLAARTDSSIRVLKPRSIGNKLRALGRWPLT
jgi:hypothetical protein